MGVLSDELEPVSDCRKGPTLRRKKLTPLVESGGPVSLKFCLL